MNIKEALACMKEGNAVKLPKWDGYWTWEDDGVAMYSERFKRFHLTNTEILDYLFDERYSDQFKRLHVVNPYAPEHKFDEQKEMIDFEIATPENSRILKGMPVWNSLQALIRKDADPIARYRAEGTLLMLILLEEPLTGDDAYNNMYVRYRNGKLEYHTPDGQFSNTAYFPWRLDRMVIATEENCKAKALEQIKLCEATGDHDGMKRIYALIPEKEKTIHEVFDIMKKGIVMNHPECNPVSFAELDQMMQTSKLKPQDPKKDVSVDAYLQPAIPPVHGMMV